MSAIVLLLGAGGDGVATAGPEAPEDVPAFTYEQYSDAQGHFTYDGAALKLVKRPAHLARVYGDAAREDARAKVLVSELEHWFHQAGALVADTTTRPACLPLPEMTPECQPNWQFLTEFLGDTPEATRLRQVVAHAYEARARERRLQNNVIVAGVNLLLAGGMAKGVMNQAATAEARGATRQALVTEVRAAQVRAAGRSGIVAREIRFGQESVKSTFAHGPFKGRTIGQVAADLRAGKSSPDDLPIEFVVRNGESIALNNRSLTALHRAGIEPTRLIDRTGDVVAERLLDAHLRGAAPSDVIRIRGGVPNASLLE